MALSQLLFNGIYRQLAEVEKDETLRPISGNLPTKFAADTPPRAGDEHRTPVEEILQSGLIKPHWIAPQQILKLDITHLFDTTTGFEFNGTGYRKHREVSPPCQLKRATALIGNPLTGDGPSPMAVRHSVSCADDTA